MRDTVGGTPPAQRDGFDSEQGNGHGGGRADLASSEAVLSASLGVPQAVSGEAGAAQQNAAATVGPSGQAEAPAATEVATPLGTAEPTVGESSAEAAQRLTRWMEQKLVPPAPSRRWRLREQRVLDYYQVLGVPAAAPPEVITAAHFELQRRLARDAARYDRSRERLRRVEAAYEVLSNPARRAAYERMRVARYVVEPVPANGEHDDDTSEPQRPRLGLSDRVLPLLRARDGGGEVGYLTLCNLGDGSIHGRAVPRAPGVSVIPHVFNFTETLTLMVRVDRRLARNQGGPLLDLVTDAGTAALLAPWRPSPWRRVWNWVRRRRPRVVPLPRTAVRRRGLLEALGMVSVVALSLLAASYAMNLLASTLLLPSQVVALRNLGRSPRGDAVAIDHLSAPYPLDRSAWVDLREQLVLTAPTPVPTLLPTAEPIDGAALALDGARQERVEIPPRLVPALQTPLSSGPAGATGQAEGLQRGSTPLDRSSSASQAADSSPATPETPRPAARSPRQAARGGLAGDARAAVAAISPLRHDPAPAPTRTVAPTPGEASAPPATPAPTLVSSGPSLRDAIGWRQRFAGSVAEVSNPRPRQYSDITARLRLVRDGQPVAGAPVYFLVHYRTVEERWPGEGYVTTNSDGVAEVTFNVENATRRYTVRVEALAEVEGQQVAFTTAFTPP